MLSIIVCSRNKELKSIFLDNIDKTIGIEYEIISIDNSDNSYSICSAYNAGFTQSKYPYICFVHEDVLFHTQNWGERIINHLRANGTGIIGLAGVDLVTRVPISWSKLTLSINIIQSDKTDKKETKRIKSPENYEHSKRDVILLDGVMLSMSRELMMEIKFDEKIEGFHGYDLDISIQSAINGYTNYVVYDIELEHFSRGKTNAIYYQNIIYVFKKWNHYLPMIGKSITNKEREEISSFEENGLQELIKKMIRKGFSTRRIIHETSYFAMLISSEKALKKLKHLRFYIFCVRLFNKPFHLLKSTQF